MAKGSGGGNRFNLNSSKTLNALNRSGGMMSPSFAKEKFPVGSKVELIDMKGERNVFKITGYKRPKSGLMGTGGKAIIPKLKKLSGKGTNEITDFKDLAFVASVGRSVNLKTRVKIIK